MKQEETLAIDWLVQWMNKNQYFIGNDLLEAVKEAKHLEMMQIVKAYHRGLFGSMEEKPIVFADEYYKETYKK